MIIGHGLLARAFSVNYENDPNVLIFASGVSNSTELRQEEFQREKFHLQEALSTFTGRRFAYFGSCGVVNVPGTLSPYLAHKLEMERLVLAHPAGIVFRLPQVVSHTNNPHTLTNYLYDRIKRGEHFKVWANAERNLIDIEDAFAIAHRLLQLQKLSENVVNIASDVSIRVLDIVNIFERMLGKLGNYTIVPEGDSLHIDSLLTQLIAHELGIDMRAGYAERVLLKYYGNRF
ncbi:NAD-dependent epimerase/dehydratase family protein [Leptospira sp. SA-E8]|uniref:NAD-dependent epimerase/dehydratase family protein n=1 Tax=Leptospira sp. SA-E8 TaxID=3422259 RepID=UPI003EC0C743